MQQSKLVELLSALSRVEMTRLADFVYSPYHNKHRDVQTLFDYLNDQYPRFEPAKLQRESVWQEIFPGVPFDDKRLRYLMSDLTRLAEEFLGLESLRSRDHVMRKAIVESLRERNLGDRARDILRRMEKSIDADPRRDGEFYFRRLETEILAFENSYRRASETSESIKAIITDLDIWYIIRKLRFSSELLNEQNIWAGDSQPLLLDEILDYLDKHPGHNHPAIAIYQSILLSIRHPEDEAHYHRLRELLVRHAERFSHRELDEMYIYATNYCALKINAGQTKYLAEILDIYKQLLADKIIYADGYLSQWDYKNIATVALRLKEFAWVEEFLKREKPNLREEVRQSAFRYNKAALAYHLGKYDKTLELLRDVEIKDVYLDLDRRSLLLRTYYEIEAIDPLYSLIDAFYAFLRRNTEISMKGKTEYKNYLSFCKKLVKVRRRPDKARKLLEQLEAAENVLNKRWLREKLRFEAGLQPTVGASPAS